MPTLTPHLWFDNEAEEAAQLYCSIFPDSRILETHKYDTGGDQAVVTVTFEVCGQRFIGLNGGPHFKPDEAFSFFVECDTQEEVDLYWEILLADGGQESQCGWLKDKYGLSWQIIPKLLMELNQDEDPEKAARVMQAMLKMRKIECDVLQAAYNGEPVDA